MIKILLNERKNKHTIFSIQSYCIICLDFEPAILIRLFSALQFRFPTLEHMLARTFELI